MTANLCVGVDDIYEATCYVLSCPPVFFFFFCTRCFSVACCSDSDSAVCPLCFIGSVCSVLLASHFVCQNEARAFSLAAFQQSHFHKFLTGTFTLSAHSQQHICCPALCAFHLYFGHKVGSRCFYIVLVTFKRGNPWVQLSFRNLIDPKSHSNKLISKHQQFGEKTCWE